MFYHPLLKIFNSNKTDHEVSNHFCNMCRHTTESTPLRNSNVCRSGAAISNRSPICHLPHTTINSNLGSRHDTFRLQFNRFLVEDPSIAVFSIEQETPISSVWRDEDRGGCYGLGLAYGWAQFFTAPRSRCNVTMSVGKHWTLGVSNKAIRYWSIQDKVMLVDWDRLYESYFEQVKKTKDRQMSGRLLDRGFGQDEDTPPNRVRERVVQVDADPPTARSTAHELSTRFNNGLRVVRNAIRSRVGEERSRIWRQESFALARVPILWTNPSYQMLR
jgi:hypothetical protein